MTIKIIDKELSCTVKAKEYQIDICLKSGLAKLSNKNNQFLFEFPLDFMMETANGALHMNAPLRAEYQKNEIIISSEIPAPGMLKQKLKLKFRQETFTADFSCTSIPGESIKPGKIEYFRNPKLGMRLRAMRSAFCIRSSVFSEEQYQDLFPSASALEQSSPPCLNISLGFADGWVGLGLLDLSDATVFGVSAPLMGLAVDSKGGNIDLADNNQYIGPMVLFTFPGNGEAGLREFYKYLKNEDMLEQSKPRPDWWKRPLYCTYGDQIMDMQPAPATCYYWGAPDYTEQWVKDAVINAEDKLGYKNFTVTIDAFWQKPWDTDPVGDPERFPDMRKLIDWLHERGHKVILWYLPHGLAANNDSIGKIARKHEVVGKYTTPDYSSINGQVALTFMDYTAPGAENYLKELSKRFFSDEDGCLNCDGLKLDFLGYIPPTEENASHFCPEKGMGFRHIKNYLTMFYKAARAIKSDVLFNYSASDPRFSHLFSMHRVHDIKVNAFERERRARIAVTADPDLLIDSDGAKMYTDWVAQSYIPAAIYGTPSLYYAKRFADGKIPPDETMKTLGKLFQMCSKRAWGQPEFISYGNWRLRDKEKHIIGEAYAGDFCWIKTGKKLIEAIGFSDCNYKICLHGKKVKTITPEPENMHIESDTIIANWRAGVKYVINII